MCGVCAVADSLLCRLQQAGRQAGRQVLLAVEQQQQLGAELKHLGGRSGAGERGQRT